MSEINVDRVVDRAARSRVFYCLDALRGIAAAVVLTRHAPSFFGTGLFPGSALGVDLFFVMSGFVIATLTMTASRMVCPSEISCGFA